MSGVLRSQGRNGRFPDRLLSPLEWRFSRLGSDVLRVRPPCGFVDVSRLDAIRGSECQSQAGLRGVPGSGSRCVSRRGSAPPSDTPRGLFHNLLMGTQTKTGKWSPDEQETSPLKLLKPKLDYDSGTQNPPCWQLTRRHHSAGALLARHTRASGCASPLPQPSEAAESRPGDGEQGHRRGLRDG